MNTKRLDVLKVTEKIEDHIREKYPEILGAARDRRLSANFNMFAMCSIHGETSQAQQCWELIKKYRNQSLFDSKVRSKNKIGILLSYLGKNVFSSISKIIYKNN